MYNRPDFSKYLIHFTKDRRPDSESKSNVALDFKGVSAKDRLLNILEPRQILASRLTTGNNADACCFTECVWSSLLTHTLRYSSYGIGFSKKFICFKKGNPVFYVEPNMFNKYKIDKELLPFLALYDPLNKNKVIDFTHEREWRIAKELKFAYYNVQFLILKNYDDIQDFLPYIEQIGHDKVILMDNYKKVESLWPLLHVNTK